MPSPYRSKLRPFGEKGCALASLGASPCETDHVVGDKPDMEQFFDAAGAQGWPSHAPKGPAVISEYPDADYQPERDQDGAPQIAGVEARSR
jgi:hypothetical protein